MNVFIVLSLVFYGLWGFASKVAAKYNSPQVISLIACIVYGITTLYWIVLIKTQKIAVNVSPTALFWAVIAGGAMMAGSIFFFFAISKIDASVAAAMIAAYPVVTAVLSFIFLSEQITPMKIIGICLIVSGVIFVSR